MQQLASVGRGQRLRRPEELIPSNVLSFGQAPLLLCFAYLMTGSEYCQSTSDAVLTQPSILQTTVGRHSGRVGRFSNL